MCSQDRRLGEFGCRPEFCGQSSLLLPRIESWLLGLRKHGTVTLLAGVLLTMQSVFRKMQVLRETSVAASHVLTDEGAHITVSA
jgi:hypothetical protein